MIHLQNTINFDVGLNPASAGLGPFFISKSHSLGMAESVPVQYRNGAKKHPYLSIGGDRCGIGCLRCMNEKIDTFRGVSSLYLHLSQRTETSPREKGENQKMNQILPSILSMAVFRKLTCPRRPRMVDIIVLRESSIRRSALRSCETGTAEPVRTLRRTAFASAIVTIFLTIKNTSSRKQFALSESGECVTIGNGAVTV